MLGFFVKPPPEKKKNWENNQELTFWSNFGLHSLHSLN